MPTDEKKVGQILGEGALIPRYLSVSESKGEDVVAKFSGESKKRRDGVAFGADITC